MTGPPTELWLAPTQSSPPTSLFPAVPTCLPLSQCLLKPVWPNILHVRCSTTIFPNRGHLLLSPSTGIQMQGKSSREKGGGGLGMEREGGMAVFASSPPPLLLDKPVRSCDAQLRSPWSSPSIRTCFSLLSAAPCLLVRPVLMQGSGDWIQWMKQKNRNTPQ